MSIITYSTGSHKNLSASAHVTIPFSRRSSIDRRHNSLQSQEFLVFNFEFGHLICLAAWDLFGIRPGLGRLARFGGELRKNWWARP